MKSRIDINVTSRLTLRKHFLLWCIALIIFILFSYLITPDDPIWIEYSRNSLMYVVRDILINFVMCMIVAEISLYINKFLNVKLAWTDKPRRRLAIQTILNVISSLVLVILVYYVTIFIGGDKYRISNRKDLINCIQWLLTTTIVSLAISGINTLNYLLTNWKNAQLEASELKLKAAKLKEATMEAELEALKLQIDPHFIFNNLSVLSELILEDQQLGHDYVEHFAKVYRYLLINSKKDLITIGEEVNFLESYIFLLIKRFGTGLKINIDLDKKIYEKSIPPFTLQMLVENAIKHNQTSKAHPLDIRIFLENKDILVVQNSINALVSKLPTTGFGLKNIETRFSYLLHNSPITEKTEDLYIVRIPINS